MPVWNAAPYLREALESIWRQKFRDFELIVVDDGSTDETPDILRTYRDPRLCVVRHADRRKLSQALNTGLEYANGEFIARMDADDIMSANRLAIQVMYLSKNPHLACCGGWVRTFGNAKPEVWKFPEEPTFLKAFALFYTPFAHPTVMFRREWFEREHLRYDGSYYPAEDYELWTRVLDRFPCGNVSRVILNYRVRVTGMTGAEWPEMEAQTKRIYRNMLVKIGWDPTPEQLQAHRDLAMGRVPSDREAILRAERWLLTVMRVNERTKYYDQEALEEIVNYVWFRAAMGLVRALRGETWLWYRKSPLARCGRRAKARAWMVKLAALKASATPFHH